MFFEEVAGFAAGAVAEVGQKLVEAAHGRASERRAGTRHKTFCARERFQGVLGGYGVWVAGINGSAVRGGRFADVVARA
jgi:hypothetical protein